MTTQDQTQAMQASQELKARADLYKTLAFMCTTTLSNDLLNEYERLRDLSVKAVQSTYQS